MRASLRPDSAPGGPYSHERFGLPSGVRCTIALATERSFDPTRAVRLRPCASVRKEAREAHLARRPWRTTGRDVVARADGSRSRKADAELWLWPGGSRTAPPAGPFVDPAAGV